MSNPPHEPNDQVRKTVAAMAGYGQKQIDIAAVVGIDPKTLRKHYREELDLSAIKTNSQVAQSHFLKCTGRPAEFDDDGNMIREEIKPEITAIIWWEKARMGWKETSRVELTGANSGPIRTVHEDMSPIEASDAYATSINSQD